MNNFYSRSLNAAKEKYYKFRRRLEKKINSGEFNSLPRRKKNQLIYRVEKYKSRLEKLGFSMKGTAVAGSVAAMAAIPSIGNAQSIDPKFFQKTDFSFSSIGTNNGQAANLDLDADLEIIASSGSQGYVINGNANDGFIGTSQMGLSGLSDDFVIGDIDGDDFPDVVFEYNGNIRWAKNNGSGAFDTSYQTVASGAFTSDLEIADFDSDGDNDIVWATGGSYVHAVENIGGGSFAPATTILSLGGEETITHIELADLDKDGDMDLVSSRQMYDFYYNAELSIGPYTYNYDIVEVRNNTAGGESIPVFDDSEIIRDERSFSSYISSLDLVDLDDDGDLDVVSSFEYYYSGDYEVNINVQLGNHATDNPAFDFLGEETFEWTYFSDLLISDVDQDGDKDIIFANEYYSPYLISVGASQLKTSSLNYRQAIPLGDFSSSGGDFILGDFDGDGIDDLIVENGSVSLYLNVFPPFPVLKGDMVVNEGLTEGSVIARLETTGQTVSSAVLDGDDAAMFSFSTSTNELTITEDLDYETHGGSLDFSLTVTVDGVTETIERSLTIVNMPEKGHGTISEEPIQLFGNQNVNKFKFSDVDNDGDMDLITATKYAPELIDRSALAGGYPNTVWKQLGGGVFTQESIYELDYGIDAFVMADVDQDGDEDLVASADFSSFPKYAFKSTTRAASSGDFKLLSNNEGYFYFDNLGFTGEAEMEADQMIVADIDGDGLDDLIIIDNGDVYAMKGIEGGFANTNYEFRYQYFDALQIIAGDFDGDDIDDVLMLNEEGSSLITYGREGLFEGGEANYSYVFDSESFNVTASVGDIDGDGMLDVLVTNEEGTNIYINEGGEFSNIGLINESTYTEGTSTSGSIESNVIATKLGDLDGDEDLDLASIMLTTEDNPEGPPSYNMELITSLNDGDGNFEEGQRFMVNTAPDLFSGYSKYLLDMVDVDNDGDMDVIISGSDYSFDEEADYLSGLLVFKNQNAAPTGIELSISAVAEGTAIGSSVGELSVIDPNINDTHVLFMTAGDGTNDADNSKFVIDGNQLLVIKEIDLDEGDELNIHVKAIDEYGASVTAPFTLTVNEKVLGLDENNDQLVLYPNPGADMMDISVNQPMTGDAEIRISDLNGREIYSELYKVSGESLNTKVDMSNHRPGIYIVEITAGDQTFKQRWIKKD
ncbi:T9SS type A sorting domain-containing protein [Ekhidna sp.]|uniref:T9SS type A sorting domain-containing protein n=1 Tax=Ekhidna sp. TaxID=2608089 RepID=UPI0035149C4B